MRTTGLILVISLLSLTLGGCNGLSHALADVPSTSQEISTEPPEDTDMTIIPPGEAKLVNLAKQDLADRLKIDLAQINLFKTMEIKSPNISAGCKPGAGQIITKGSQVYGYRIWLETGVEEYIYHIGLDEQIIFCPKLTPGANNPLLMTPDGSTPDPQNQSP